MGENRALLWLCISVELKLETSGDGLGGRLPWKHVDGGYWMGPLAGVKHQQRIFLSWCIGMCTFAAHTGEAGKWEFKVNLGFGERALISLLFHRRAVGCQQ